MKQQYLKNVVTLEYNSDLCTGCSMCAIVCPHAVFEMINKKAQIINKDRCMECGACMKNCPEGAIKLNTGVGCATALIYQAISNCDEVTCGGDSCC